MPLPITQVQQDLLRDSIRKFMRERSTPELKAMARTMENRIYRSGLGASVGLQKAILRDVVAIPCHKRGPHDT